MNLVISELKPLEMKQLFWISKSSQPLLVYSWSLMIALISSLNSYITDRVTSFFHQIKRNQIFSAMVVVKSVDIEIISFQHCDPSKKIFCLDYPESCPICQENLDENTQLLINPFFIPCPFVSFKSTSCCIVIRPTSGDFLQWVNLPIQMKQTLRN